jgi:hypothetical protein
MAHIPTREQFLESQRLEKLRNASHANSKQGYIVRVELHHIKDPKDYKELRQYMIDGGFHGIVVNDEGVSFKLPTATYYYPYPKHMQFISAVYEKAAIAVREALDGAYASIKADNQPPTILVTEANGLYWTGLELADDDDE